MNNVSLIGRLVRDPELRFIASSGMAVCNFTLAVDKGLSKQKKEEMEAKGQPTADFPRIIVWGKTAENCANYLSKGKQVAITGSIQTSTFKTDSGETRYSVDVNAQNVQFLEPVSKTNNQESQQEYGEITNAEDDDDIPF